MKTKQSMNVRVLVVGVYCLVAAAVLTEVQAMKTTGKQLIHLYIVS